MEKTKKTTENLITEVNLFNEIIKFYFNLGDQHNKNS